MGNLEYRGKKGSSNADDRGGLGLIGPERSEGQRESKTSDKRHGKEYALGKDL